jgi:hypothetical protein
VPNDAGAGEVWAARVPAWGRDIGPNRFSAAQLGVLSLFLLFSFFLFDSFSFYLNS